MDYPPSSTIGTSSSRLSPRRATLHYERSSPTVSTMTTGRRSPSLVYLDSINSFYPPLPSSSSPSSANSPSTGPPLTLSLPSSHQQQSTSYDISPHHHPQHYQQQQQQQQQQHYYNQQQSTKSSPSNSKVNSLSPVRTNRSPSVSPVRENDLPTGYINQRRNTLPKHSSSQYLSPDSRSSNVQESTTTSSPFSRSRSSSYFNRSPSHHRRRRSFKEPRVTSANTSPSSTAAAIVGLMSSNHHQQRRLSPFDQDSWDSYSALMKLRSDRRKMSLPVSESISPNSMVISKSLNVIIVGDTNVGKYSLVRHLIDNDSDDCNHTINTNQNQSSTNDNNQLNDRSPCQRFNSINSSIDKSVNCHRLAFPLYDNHIEIIFEYYQNVNKIMETINENGSKVRSMDILIVMYSVTDRRSFEMSAQYLTNAVFTCKKDNPGLSIALVANKTDLVRVRSVSTEEGASLADKFEVPFMEVSIELDDRFELIVEWLTNVIKEKLKIGPSTLSSSTRSSSSGLDPSSIGGSNCSEGSSSILKKPATLSERAFKFIKKIILNRRSSKSKSCDNINLM